MKKGEINYSDFFRKLGARKEDINEEKIKLLNQKQLSNMEIFKKTFKYSLFGIRNMLLKEINNLVNDYLFLYKPIYKSQLIDYITQGKNYDEIFMVFKAYMLVLILQIVSKKVFNYIYNNFISIHKTNFRILLLKSIVKKDITFFEIYKTGELINRINEFDYFEFNYIYEFINFCQAIYKMIFMIYYMLSSSKELSGIFLAWYLIDFTQNYFQFLKLNNIIILDTAKFQNKINQLISNIKMIKSFAKEVDEVNELEKILNSKLVNKFSTNILDNLSGIIEAITLLLLGKLIVNKKITFGTYLIFNQYKDQFTASYCQLENNIKNFKQIIVKFRRFLELYDFPVKIVSTKNYIPEKINGKIKFENVVFSYPSNLNSQILNHLTFEIPQGKTFAICGTSGGGKSTITNLLERLYDPQEGNIYIDDINIKNYNIEFLRKNIGYVAQEPILNDGTIEENILYGVDDYDKLYFEEILELSNVNSFVNDKYLFPDGLKTLVGERGIKVSGGQKQRIAIARALMKNTKILIFDEATSALDAESESEVQKAIDNIVKKKGTTIIIIAHRLSTIINADIIAVLDKGKIVEIGKHNELMNKNGEYRKLFQKQIEKFFTK